MAAFLPPLKTQSPMLDTTLQIFFNINEPGILFVVYG